MSNRKIILLLVMIFTCASNMEAQVNYVLNPSFEQYSKCPYEYDQIEFADFWSPIDTVNHSPADSFGSSNCTPEYCNVCATNRKVSVPSNDRFYHYPRTGKGVVQMMMFSDEVYSYPYLRDYLQGRLYKNLTAGKSYCVSFYVTLESIGQYAINHIGAYLDNGQIDTNGYKTCGLPQINYIPQIVSNVIINDTLNWTKIEGSFVANGDEKFITIGDFFDKAHTTYISSITGSYNSGLTLYLVDDVSVIESNSKAFAGHDTSIVVGDSIFIGQNEILPDIKWYYDKPVDTGYGWFLLDTMHAGLRVKPGLGVHHYAVQQTLCGLTTYDTITVNVLPVGIKNVNGISYGWSLYPNPARNELTVVSGTNVANAQISISDVSGRTMLRQPLKFDHGKARINLSLSPGVYLVRLDNNDDDIGNVERLVIY